MDGKFMFGLLFGMVGGALIVANSAKARQVVKDGQTKVLDEADKLKAKSKNSSKKSS